MKESVLWVLGEEGTLIFTQISISLSEDSEKILFKIRFNDKGSWLFYLSMKMESPKLMQLFTKTGGIQSQLQMTVEDQSWHQGGV
jgi:hypothetical protein